MSLNRKNRAIPARVLITLAIWQYGKDGISGKGLEKISGVSRQTINHERDGLRREGLIDYKHNGKRTTYYPGKSVVDNQYLRSIIYGRKLLDTLTYPPLNTNSPFFDWQLSYDDKIERTLVQFCLRIGILLLYSFLQMMNPKSYGLLLASKEESIVISSKGIKEHLIKEWLKNSIDFEKILVSLRQSLYLLGYKFKVESNKKYPANHPFFELEHNSYMQITQAFTRVFPTAFEQLEKIGSDLDKDTDHWKTRRKRHECKHDYQMSIEKNTRIFVCTKCSNRITVAIDAPSNTKKEVGIPMRMLNALKPPVNNNCIKFGHQWDDHTGHQVNKLWYVCLLCRTTIKLNFESDEEMQLIEEEVSINIGIQYERLTQHLEYFFHYNKNKAVTIWNFIEFYEMFRPGTKIVDKKLFIGTVAAIIEILINHSYIKLKSDYIDPLRKEYMRELAIDL